MRDGIRLSHAVCLSSPVCVRTPDLNQAGGMAPPLEPMLGIQERPNADLGTATKDKIKAETHKWSYHELQAIYKNENLVPL